MSPMALISNHSKMDQFLRIGKIQKCHSLLRNSYQIVDVYAHFPTSEILV
jgi:hypothetical protein